MNTSLCGHLNAAVRHRTRLNPYNRIMRIAREMERRLERLVDGATAAVFRGKMHPVDMADRLMRQADFVAAPGDAGLEIPNRWSIRVNPSDLPPTIDMNDLELELARAMEEFAAGQAWRINGPIAVEVVTDGSVPRGLADCAGSIEPGEIEAWAQLISAVPPVVLAISDNRSIMGRAVEGDIVIAIPELSRRQAIIVRTGQEATIADLSSANGTYVNAERIGNDPHPLVPGDTVTMGDIDFVFRRL